MGRHGRVHEIKEHVYVMDEQTTCILPISILWSRGVLEKKNNMDFSAKISEFYAFKSEDVAFTIADGSSDIMKTYECVAIWINFFASIFVYIFVLSLIVWRKIRI